MGQINLQVPVVGQPNSTEDPKIISDFNTLQTLVNGNLDPTNMSPTTGMLHLANRVAASNTVAAAGDMILASGGVTVTLPAAALNAMVGVVCYATNACTVSGANIFGVGLNGVSGATSFSLALGACAILHSDGTNWHTIAGRQDTGWVALTLSGSVGTLSPYYTPAARLVGDMVYLRGAMQNNSGGVLGAVTWATIPTGSRPAHQLIVPTCQIDPGGGLPGYEGTEITTLGTIIPQAGAAATFGIGLDGISYSLS